MEIENAAVPAGFISPGRIARRSLFRLRYFLLIKIIESLFDFVNTFFEIICSNFYFFNFDFNFI